MAGEFLYEPIFEHLREQELDRQNALKTEAMQVENEKAKMQQAMVAKALEAMQGGWKSGNQRVDVGGFSSGGAPMQNTMVGPGGPQRFATSDARPVDPGGGTQMQKGLARKALGLSERDPEDMLQEKMLMEAIKDTLVTKRQEGLEGRREGFKRETEETRTTRRKEEMAEKERLIRERPKSNQMKEELLRAKFDGTWTAQHQAVWDLMQPLEKLVMGSVKDRLANNMEYMMTQDPRVRDRIRAEELARALKEMDMLRTGAREEDEDEISEGEALALLKEAGGNKDKARKLAETRKGKK